MISMTATEGAAYLSSLSPGTPLLQLSTNKQHTLSLTLSSLSPGTPLSSLSPLLLTLLLTHFTPYLPDSHHLNSSLFLSFLTLFFNPSLFLFLLTLFFNSSRGLGYQELCPGKVPEKQNKTQLIAYWASLPGTWVQNVLLLLTR
jgi:hypothetical protein